jgi:predicted peptidase
MRYHFLPFLLALTLITTGCVPYAPPPTATITTAPNPTPTVAPSAVPSPTATARPTATSEPPPTTTPLPAPGLHAYTTRVEYLSGGVRQHATLRYLLFFPSDYGEARAREAQGRKWPLILFLHGSGEAGEDINIVKRVGLPALLEQQPDFPFVVVAPQLPAPDQRINQQQVDGNAYLRASGWSSKIEALNALLEQIETAYAIDRTRVYLTGLSLGGFGAWEYALRYPDRFAAVVPIAGGYDFHATKAPSSICKLKDLPIWVFHGDQDGSVPYTDSQVLVDALKACGSAVKFTLYPSGTHSDSWNLAYADPKLYEWLLEHKK